MGKSKKEVENIMTEMEETMDNLEQSVQVELVKANKSQKQEEKAEAKNKIQKLVNEHTRIVKLYNDLKVTHWSTKEDLKNRDQIIRDADKIIMEYKDTTAELTRQLEEAKKVGSDIDLTKNKEYVEEVTKYKNNAQITDNLKTTKTRETKNYRNEWLERWRETKTRDEKKNSSTIG